MILVRFVNNKDPEIVKEGTEYELIEEIHSRNLCDYHDSYFYERGKFENLGIYGEKTWDCYSMYESKEELDIHLLNQNKDDE